MKTLLYKLLFAFAVLSLVAAVIFLVSDYFLTRERLPYNTFIEGINVSLLTQPEAVQKLEELPVDKAIPSPFVVYYKDQDFFFLPSELGVALDTEKSVKEAFRQTHYNNYLRGLRHRLTKEEMTFPFVYRFDDKKMFSVVSSLESKINCASRDATVIIMGKGAYHLSPDQPGKTLQVASSLQKIKAALASGEHLLPLSVTEVPARIKYEDLVDFPPVHLLSEFTTYYGSHDSPNRIHNIQLIANTIVNGSVLLSGETFSLAEKIGDITAERGFKEAFVITEGELEPQVGGGTCQTATTLYNTVMLADLDVIKRRNHSLYFYIYPLGRDATVYGKNLDFQFRNNTGHPILITGKGTRRSLTFKIYGTPTGKRVSFSGAAVTYRSTIEGTSRTSWRPPKNVPFSTRVVRTVKKDDTIIKKEVIRSFYKLVGDGTNVVIRRPEPR
jgi:vancomycin resistance protein YoaR